jgi:hypothetical protein
LTRYFNAEWSVKKFEMRAYKIVFKLLDCEIFLLKKYIGWSIFPSLGFAKMAPRVIPDVSTCTWNSIYQLWNINIGVGCGA